MIPIIEPIQPLNTDLDMSRITYGDMKRGKKYDVKFLASSEPRRMKCLKVEKKSKSVLVEYTHKEKLIEVWLCSDYEVESIAQV